MRALLLSSLLLGACAPDLGAEPWLVSSARMLAVRAVPAEVKPGADATYTAFMATPDGVGDGSDVGAQLSWSLCEAPKPLSENDTVSSACISDGDSLVPVGMGSTLSVKIPEDACQRFGPDPPPQKAGEPPLRPRDADITGGYYQPLRVDDGTGTSFALQRITCSLAGASAKVASDFRARYQSNVNPELGALTLRDASGNDVPLTALPADATLTLHVEWPSTSVESYPVLDITTRALVDRREALRVSWFVAAGSLALSHSGRDPEDDATFAENTWHTPVAGPVSLWVVLRDDRGGVDFAKIDGEVR